MSAFTSRFANSPVMVANDRAQWLSDCMNNLAVQMVAIREKESASADEDFWPEDESGWRASIRPYKVENGTLMIPIKGVLLHDFSYQFGSWATGYIYIQKAFERGMSDPAVQRIAMVIESGGGEVAGCFDAVDKVFAMRGQKPIQAFVNEHAYSAAYAWASVADKIIVPRTGGVGSVGVVTSHVDYSKAMDEMGVKITFIFAGDHKVDGNPYEPIPEDVKNRMQARIEGLYDIFTSTVARNLGIDEAAVRATQALTYSAEEAVSIGFAHEIRAFDEAMASFGGRSVITGEVTMSQEDQSTVAQAALESARAEGQKEGALAERERIQGILACDEAKDRRELAFHLSMKTELSVENAKAVLAAAPVQAAAEQNAFAEAMKHGNPNLGSEGGDENQPSAAQQLVNDYKAFTGFKGDK